MPLYSERISSPSSMIPSIAGQVLPWARLPMISNTCCRRSTWVFGFCLVGLEGLLQFRRLGAALHLGERFQDVSLGVVDVLERVVEQSVECLLGHGLLQVGLCAVQSPKHPCVPDRCPKMLWGSRRVLRSPCAWQGRLGPTSPACVARILACRAVVPLVAGVDTACLPKPTGRLADFAFCRIDDLFA